VVVVVLGVVRWWWGEYEVEVEAVALECVGASDRKWEEGRVCGRW
jgi:hypothetical protein